MQENTVNWEYVLAKYIDHVGACEGVTFIDSVEDTTLRVLLGSIYKRMDPEYEGEDKIHV